jgi:hypothetical protein
LNTAFVSCIGNTDGKLSIKATAGDSPISTYTWSNVAEWTLTAYAENILSRVSDLNPEYRYDADDKEDPSNKRKVIRGGSWKDSHFFLQNSSRTYEFQDTTKSYIGFRNVLTFLGRSINDF